MNIRWLINNKKQICLLATVLFYFPFITKAEITLGISNAQLGPSAQLGLDLNLGAEIYFNTINNQGGINGQPVQLISLDDGYEPLNTIHNTKALINKNVTALFNYVGTPTSAAIMPLIKQNNSLFITPFTGADFLRTPDQSNIFNLRASYKQEAYAQVDYLVKKQAIDSFAIVIQADEFGLALEKYYHLALKQYGLKAKTTLRYRRNTIDIEQAAKFLRKHDVKAVLFVGTYTPLTELIKVGVKNSYNPIYSSVSFVSSDKLFNNLEQANCEHSNVLVTEVMPNPINCQFEVCKTFRAQAINHKLYIPNRIHFEGYLNAKLVATAIQSCPAPIDKICLKNSLEKIKISFVEKEKSLNPTNRQIMDKVYYSMLNLPIKL